MGPVQNAAQFEKAKEILEGARRDGRIIAGGEPGEGPGYFIRPTIVRDIKDGAQLVDEEQFAPILPIIRFDHVDDALAQVNNRSEEHTSELQSLMRISYAVFCLKK